MTTTPALFPASRAGVAQMGGPSRAPGWGVADVMAKRLSVYFGLCTARSTIERFSRRALAREPDELGVDDVWPLLVALRQPLRTLLGQAQCEIVIRQIAIECARR
jgi:hypothetical protein